MDITEKICTKCGCSKSLDAFCNRKAGKLGKHSWCKKCTNESSTKVRKSPKGQEWHKAYRKSTKYKEYKKNYDNINTNIARNLRARLRVAISGNYKAGSAVRDLGCSVEYFKEHISSKFQNGMTWENH